MEHTMTHPVSVHSLQESGNATSNLDNNEFSRMDAHKSNKKHKEASLKESHNYSTFNNKIIEWIRVNGTAIESNAFGNMSKSTVENKKRNIKNAIEAAGNKEQQKLALIKVLTSPSMWEVTKSVVNELSMSTNWDTSKKIRDRVARKNYEKY